MSLMRLILSFGQDLQIAFTRSDKRPSPRHLSLKRLSGINKVSQLSRNYNSYSRHGVKLWVFMILNCKRGGCMTWSEACGASHSSSMDKHQAVSRTNTNSTSSLMATIWIVTHTKSFRLLSTLSTKIEIRFEILWNKSTTITRQNAERKSSPWVSKWFFQNLRCQRKSPPNDRTLVVADWSVPVNEVQLSWRKTRNVYRYSSRTS